MPPLAREGTITDVGELTHSYANEGEVKVTNRRSSK
jgi:hypothetical protein